MEVKKSVLLSKTFWFGVITAVAPLVPGVSAWVAGHLEIVGSVWGGLAVVLRLVSKDKVVLLP